MTSCTKRDFQMIGKRQSAEPVMTGETESSLSCSVASVIRAECFLNICIMTLVIRKKEPLSG